MTNQWFSTTGREGLIVPKEIPGAEINPDRIYDAARQLGMVAIQLPVGSKRVTTAWTSLSNVMRVSGTEPLHSALTPPMQDVIGVAENFDKAATALRVFAGTCERILPQLTGIRQEAREFVSGITWDGMAWMPHYTSVSWQNYSGTTMTPPHGKFSAPGTLPRTEWPQDIKNRGTDARLALDNYTLEVLVHWRESKELVERNNDLVDRVAHLVADFVDAERRCATTINLLRSAPAVPIDATFARPTDGGVTAYPWGHKVEKVTTRGERQADGVVQSLTDTANFYGLFVGYNPSTGGFWDYDYAETVAKEAAVSTAAGVGALSLPVVAGTYLVNPAAGRKLTDRGIQHWEGVLNVQGWKTNPDQAAGALGTDIIVGAVSGVLTAGVGTAGTIVSKTVRSSAASSATRVSKRLSGVSTRAGAFVDARIAGPLRGPGQVSFAPDTFVKPPGVDKQLGLAFEKEFPSSVLTDKPEPAPLTWDEKVLEKGKEEAPGVIGTGAEPVEDSTPLDGSVPSHPDPALMQHSHDAPEPPASLTLGLDEARSKWRDELRESLRAAAGNPPVPSSVTADR
ncbi:hypothetical protein [Jonesia quinghaiensis]|uniref:hypothetical protein n=1 Tax=Jonesia quinghaiensis TaxID=262806 RepID=UPI0004029D36|nr:hypothetical protein [Jonesia quinghaiensis]